MKILYCKHYFLRKYVLYLIIIINLQCNYTNYSKVPIICWVFCGLCIQQMYFCYNCISKLSLFNHFYFIGFRLYKVVILLTNIGLHANQINNVIKIEKLLLSSLGLKILYWLYWVKWAWYINKHTERQKYLSYCRLLFCFSHTISLWIQK